MKWRLKIDAASERAVSKQTDQLAEVRLGLHGRGSEGVEAFEMDET